MRKLEWKMNGEFWYVMMAMEDDVVAKHFVREENVGI